MGNELEAGALVGGKFRVEHKLGEGAMGVVYAARHEELGIAVALKVLLPEVAKDPQFVARFLQEARAAARIEGEHIARVKDVGRLDSGVPFMVMDLLEGEDLSKLIERTGALEPGIAVAYVLHVLAGILETHDLGVVHRDLKPSNLFVVHRAGRADKIKILDFGISKSGLDKSGSITTTGATIGSPAYMSPEQVRSSKNVDVRADIWSIGVIAYELLTGTMPFAGESVGATFAAILETVPVPPHERNERVPPALSDIVMRCLRRAPAERFQSASDLIEALGPFASKLPVSAPAAGASGPHSAASRVTGTQGAMAETVAAPEIVQTQHTWNDNRAAPRKRVAWAVFALAIVCASSIVFLLARMRVTTSVAAPPVTADSATAPRPIVVETPAPVTAASASATATASAIASAKPSPMPAAHHTSKPPTPSATASADDSRLFMRH